MNILRLNKSDLQATVIKHDDRIVYNITAGKEVKEQEEVKAKGEIAESYMSSILKTLLNDGFILTEILNN